MVTRLFFTTFTRRQPLSSSSPSVSSSPSSSLSSSLLLPALLLASPPAARKSPGTSMARSAARSAASSRSSSTPQARSCPEGAPGRLRDRVQHDGRVVRVVYGKGRRASRIEQISRARAVFNVVNVMMGVGLLSLPFALKSSGWVGLLVLWVMGIATNYTAKVLCECAEAVTARNPGGGAVSYEDIAEAAFGPIGRVIISAIIYVELFGTCALLFILEVLCGERNGPMRTAWNYAIALLGLVCTYCGTTASMKSLAAKAAGVA
ncbi:Vacuolar amino acid transporter 1 [Tetrabaena socialis]|uniref:Vacuolar amino acid transporter 1 n=1 Tax=Tetrabaena socialis TaxID=47790 RepID=A0A2J8AHU7_9CHLO|nr:Vacuolar amino acid transporter 1 [Tetrabaena socialis]|eukprot:PNH12095.1 Vacuolar amino acid transporter 1 [Tetrabaena socialis]